MGFDARKHVLGVANNKSTDQSAHPCRLISAFVIRILERIISNLATGEISSYLLVSVAEQTGLSLAMSEPPKEVFLSLSPNTNNGPPLLSLYPLPLFFLSLTSFSLSSISRLSPFSFFPPSPPSLFLFPLLSLLFLSPFSFSSPLSLHSLLSPFSPLFLSLERKTSPIYFPIHTPLFFSATT